MCASTSSGDRDLDGSLLRQIKAKLPNSDRRRSDGRSRALGRPKLRDSSRRKSRDGDSKAASGRVGEDAMTRDDVKSATADAWQQTSRPASRSPSPALGQQRPVDDVGGETTTSSRDVRREASPGPDEQKSHDTGKVASQDTVHPTTGDSGESVRSPTIIHRTTSHEGNIKSRDIALPRLAHTQNQNANVIFVRLKI